MIEKVEEIQQLESKYTPFVVQISQWANDFQADKIEDFIVNLLDKSGVNEC